MPTQPKSRTRRHGQGGAILASLAVSLTAFFAIAVVAVDLGRLGHTATEVQSVADIAATAGATAMWVDDTVSDGTVISQAQDVVAQNRVDGQTASIAAGDVQLGNWDWDTGSFSAGGAPRNAVRATGRATVENIIADIFGTPTTAVEKVAIAAVGGVSSGYPALPIVVGECEFEAYQNSDDDCSLLPKLTEAPENADNSAWTSLSADPASASGAIQYFPADCGGGGVDSPSLNVGADINILNGQTTSILQVIKECFEKGYDTWLIPIVPCGTYNQAMDVLGFATIKITSVDATGTDKGITLTTICEEATSGGVGGGNFGTQALALVQ